jgi:uncharacterized protein YqgC (DUF456 family)
MEWLAYVVAVLFCVLGAACVLSIVFSIPGAWIMLALAAVIELFDQLYLPDGRQQTFDWWVLGVCLGLVALSELLEFAAGAAGAKTGGASRRGMIGALIGGIAGAILLTGLVPIPIIGSLIGAMIGSFAGAVIGEVSGQQPKSVGGSMKPALGATIGRLAGTMGKLAIAAGVWAALSVSALVP